MFWPYAYDDFVDYTFYPHAYDTFWPYAYDDLYEGAFGRYAEGYGGTYAAVRDVEIRQSARRRHRPLHRADGGPHGLADRAHRANGGTDDTQRAALDELEVTTAKALDLLEAACPTDLCSTPTGRMRPWPRGSPPCYGGGLLQPQSEKFYQSLNDEQKARFNALGADDDPDQRQSRRD